MNLPKPERQPQKPRRRIRTSRPPGTKRREAKAAGYVDPDTWEAILAFYGYKCGICEGPPWQQQGHARSIAHGGDHSAANVFPICQRCNYYVGSADAWPYHRHPWMEKP